MATTPAKRRRAAYSDEDLQQLITLIQDVDSVELKLTVPERVQRSALMALNLDPLQAEIRTVYFLDTPDLQLDAKGLVVRARRSQRKGDDTVVKLRPVVPSELPKAVRKSPSFFIEVDASPTGFVCSGSMKAVPAACDVLEAVTGQRRLRKLFTKEQQALFAEHAPDGLTMDDLHVLGPIFVLKLKYLPQGLANKLVVEMWLYPGGARVLELSTKCLPADTFRVAAETRAYLSSIGIELDGKQQTKTRTALEFFSQHIDQAQQRPE
jgi:hypothetical protein